MRRLGLFFAAMFMFYSTALMGTSIVFVPNAADMSSDDTMFTDIFVMKNVNIVYGAAAGEEIKYIFYSTLTGIGVTAVVVAETLRVEGGKLSEGQTLQFQARGILDSIYISIEAPANAYTMIWPDRK